MSTFNFIPSAEQTAFYGAVRKADRNLILEAVAGSGKTTSLVQAMPLMEGQVAYLVFNARNAEEAKAKTAGLRHVTAATVHSFGMRAFRRQQRNARVVKHKVRFIIDAMMSRMSEESRKIVTPFLGVLGRLVMMAKDAGIGISGTSIDNDALWLAIIEHHDLTADIELEDNTHLLKAAKWVLRKSNSDLQNIDFADMIYLPLLLNFPVQQFNWVLIDEAQDTNFTRRELARRMVAKGGRFVAVGDPHQAIYGFTGANNDALSIIREEFDAATMPLSTSYRSDKAIIAEAQKYVSHIRASDSAQQGEVSAVDYEAFMANVADLKPSDAILSRLNFPLVELAFALIRKGIPARVRGRDLGDQLASFVRKFDTQDLNELEVMMDAFVATETVKLVAEKKEAKADTLADKADTVKVLIARAREIGRNSQSGLLSVIDGMFSDEEDKEMLTLSSIHKAKGLEWSRVFILGRNQFIVRTSKEWQKEQETNLLYVAVTRAQHTLVDIVNVPQRVSSRSSSKRERTDRIDETYIPSELGSFLGLEEVPNLH